MFQELRATVRIQKQQNQVEIIGYFLNRLNYRETQQQNSNPTNLMISQIRQIIKSEKYDYNFKPIDIITDSQSIAIVDNLHRGWLVTEFLNEPVCLSSLLKTRISKIQLVNNQAIIHIAKKTILLVWGAQKIFKEEHLIRFKINQRQPHHSYFEAFQIKQFENSCQLYFSNVKKRGSDEIMFINNKQNKTLTDYITKDNFIFQNYVKGLSIGKNHYLCWDEEGTLFSWGYPNIALGYYDSNSQNQNNSPLTVKLKSRIIEAYADDGYSLALTVQGKLYEWGLKKIGEDKEQRIFEPRLLTVKNQNGQLQKVIGIKGKQGKFCCLTLSSNLYVWGRKMDDFFSQNTENSMPDSFLVDPTLLNVSENITTFSIQQSFIAIMTKDKIDSMLSPRQNKYFLNLKEKISKNLAFRVKGNKKMERFHTTCERKSILNKENLSLAKTNFHKNSDPHQQSYQNKLKKKQYIQNIKMKHSEKMIEYVLEPYKNTRNSINISQLGYQKSQEKVQNKKEFARYFNRTIKTQDFNKTVVRDLDFIKQLIIKQDDKRKKMKKVKISKQSLINKLIKKKQMGNDQKNYKQRLETVRKNKEMRQNISFIQTIRKVQTRSIDFKLQQKKYYEELHKFDKQKQAIKSSLFLFLVKNYLIRFIIKPLNEGRLLKIANFSRYIRLQRIQRNIRKLFVKARISFQLKKLRQQKIGRFFMLIVKFKSYINFYRKKKIERSRASIITECFKSVIREKLKIGISTCAFNIKKINKFREWLVIVKTERKKCVKYVWKIKMLSMMGINSEAENSTVCYLPKNMEQITFQSLYKEKVAQNPILKLQNFLNKNSIFKVKACYFQRIVTLFKEQTKKGTIIKTNPYVGKGKNRIKFSQDDKFIEKQDKLNLMQNDILPYSTHHKLLIKPKQYDFMIPQLMKVNEKWIRQQKKILEFHIEKIIEQHQKNYITKRKTYDIQLANFIRKRYDLLSQKRWRYILQYNKIEKSSTKVKKQKQLKRIMGLIGMVKVIEDDCMPEKHLLLDQAVKRLDAPKCPTSCIKFDQAEFKRVFRSYYEKLISKYKEFRKILKL